jgi:hypothetical protein
MVRPDELAARLVDAASTGEILRIIYHGGGQPGTWRDVRPIAVIDDTLRAYDVAAGEEKRFRLSKIEIADEGYAGAPAYDGAAVSSDEEQSTIRDFFTPRIASLEALGWHVVWSRDALSLHRRFKNGKPRKTPEVEIIYEPMVKQTPVPVTVIVARADLLEGTASVTRHEEPAPPTPDTSWRPYSVRSESLPATRRFSRLASAAALVLEQARVRAPHEPART